MSLTELVAALPPNDRKIVKALIDPIMRELILALPELNAGVKTTARQASLSATATIKGAKRGRFRGTVTVRVRTPRDPHEIDFHLDNGQLSLGLPKGWQDEPEAADESDEAPLEE
jgi:hypothetical protein